MRNSATLWVSFFLCGAFLLPSCKTVEHKEVPRLEEISRLATVEYVLTKVVRSTDERWYGDRRILFEVQANLKAGIDFEKLQEEDIVVQDGEIILNLPQPELLELEIDSDLVREKFNEKGVLRKKLSNREKDIILQLGEEDIKKKIDRIEVLKRAKDNCRAFFESSLRLQGFKKVTVNFKEVKGE